VALEFVHYYLIGRIGAFDVRLFLAAVASAGGAVIAALFGISMARCLVILMLSPAIMIVAYEIRGYRRQEAALATSLQS